VESKIPVVHMELETTKNSPASSPGGRDMTLN
jgi:hypothetical protein